MRIFKLWNAYFSYIYEFVSDKLQRLQKEIDFNWKTSRSFQTQNSIKTQNWEIWLPHK